MTDDEFRGLGSLSVRAHDLVRAFGIDSADQLVAWARDNSRWALSKYPGFGEVTIAAVERILSENGFDIASPEWARSRRMGGLS
jgi:hypothetical protein